MLDKAFEHKVTPFLVIGVILVILLGPIYWTLVTSLKTLPEAIRWPPTYWPREFTLEAYVDVLTRSPVPKYLFNSVLMALITTAIVVTAAVFTTYALTRFKFRGSKAAFMGFLVVRLIPPISLLLPFYMILRELGLINTRAAVIIYCIYLTYPLTVWMLKSFFDQFPQDLIDAALIDGASRLGALFKVVLPVIANGIAAVAIIAFLWTWIEFLAPFLFLNTDNLKPITVGLYYFVGDETTYWNSLTACAILSIIPGIIFFVLAQRYIISGLTAGFGKE
jgi:ABC-type glycerol-3-phosphate transport system permease component